MKQVIQNIRNGALSLQEIPAPMVQPGQVLIANQASLISAGTEKLIMDLAGKSLLGKARERPDQVKRVLEKIRNEGLLHTVNQVRTKLDEPMTMGYSSAGIVLACGAGVQDLKPGDRVASNGPHAEVVCVPRNLCAKIPDNVPFSEASFAILGSIALQAIRLSRSELGETAFVIGLGLIGQIAVLLLRAAGVRVIGTDLDAAKCEQAIRLGAEVARPGLSGSDVEQLTAGLGSDVVLITASTTSNQPIELAAAAVRQKGRIVLLGVAGLELDRRPFYFKEAEFVVSCSYGPGRYDPDYEERGHDYPAAYVRWTEQRNIQAILDLMGSGSLNVGQLITHHFPSGDAMAAYDLIQSGNEPYLGIVLEYPELAEEPAATTIKLQSSPSPEGPLRFGVLGAGGFARMVLLPAIAKCSDFQPVTICSGKGVSGTHAGKISNFAKSTTDENEVFNDSTIETIFSITRHDQHARHVIEAIAQGKNVFVEKPLCLSIEELQQIEAALIAAGDAAPMVMVGFNRRFAPSVEKLKEGFNGVHAPLTVSIRFNAGAIPADHWTQNDVEGGGRIIGEACHAIDLATHITGSPPVRVFAESVGTNDAQQITDDQCFITLRHANGSISSIAYLAGGSSSFPKERIEVIGGGRVGVIDDYRSVALNSGGSTKTTKTPFDKGHQGEIQAFASALRSGKPAISWEELRSVTLASILAVRSLRESQAFDI